MPYPNALRVTLCKASLQIFIFFVYLINIRLWLFFQKCHVQVRTTNIFPFLRVFSIFTWSLLPKFSPTSPFIPWLIALLVNYLCMNDLLCHLNQPSICDIKIGRVTYSSDSSPNKIRLEEAKYAWRKDLGFFITAMRVSFVHTHCILSAPYN